MSKINLKNTPFLGIVIPLMAGIALFYELPRSLSVWFWIIAAICTIGGILCDVFLKRSLPLFVICFMAIGFISSWVSYTEPAVPKDEKLTFISRVEEMPLVKGRWQTAQATIDSYKDSILGWQPVTEKTLLSIDTSQNVAIGQTVTYSSRLYSIDSTYGKYMANSGVFSRSYAYRIDVLAGDTTAMQKIDIWRYHLAEKLNTADSSWLAAALTLGDKRGLDRSLRKDYSRSGTAHLLAVSGLHVGIIFAILNIMLGWIRLYRGGLAIMGCGVITLLWGYALMTGMSPSVLRAVIMFTLYQIGIMTSRGGSSLNILAVSAFILLLVNPRNLYDVGFQMSYMAMVGITVLYRPLYSLVNPKNAPLRWLWGLTVVSLTAQIGVMPLVVYYFGQMPLVGLLITPVVWFTVPVVIIGGFAYLAFGWHWLGISVGWVAGLQNSIVSWTASHWWVAVENIRMPLWGLWIIYAVLIAAIILVNNFPRKSLDITGKSLF